MYGEDITDEEAKIGYVGAWPYAEVISGYTSFYLGVKSVVANVTMQVKYTNSWYDEPAEKNAALALIGAGAKLVSGHADSMGVPTACKEQNVPNVFYNNTSPEQTFVIASKINWQPYFEYMIDGVTKEGATIAKDWTGTIATGSVVVTDLGPAAAEGTQDVLNTVKAELVAGTRKVFDTANFTVRNAKANDQYGNITMDEESGRLVSYLADIIDLGNFAGETNAVEDGIFTESSKRSAPYFDIIIDGISIMA
jgi:basic membrane protein A